MEMNRGIQITLGLLALMFLISVNVFSQNEEKSKPKVEPKIELIIEAPGTVMVGERFQLCYKIKTSDFVEETPEINLPEGLTVLLGPSISTTTRHISRKVDYELGYIYTVFAQSEGKIVIPKFELVVGDKKLESKDRTIVVVADRDQPKQKNKAKADVEKPTAKEESKRGNKKDNKIDDKVDAFVKTIPSKSRVGTSDTLSVVYRLYTTSKELKVLDVNFPYSRAFYGETMSSNHGEKKEKINGKEYYVFDLYKVILQPTKEGRQTFEDGQILLRYYFATGKKKRTFFGEVDEYVEKDLELKIDGFEVRVQDFVAV